MCCGGVGATTPSVDGELQRAVLCIVVSFGMLLRLEKTVANISNECIPVLEQSVHCRRTRCRGRIG